MTHRQRLGRLVPAVAVPVLALGLVACGATDDTGSAAGATSEAAVGTDEASTPPATPSTSPPAEGGQGSEAVTVTASDFEFEVDGDGVAAGEVELTLVNDGGSTHDLVVERDGEEIAAAEAVDPGGSSSVTVTLEPGEYVLYCSIANHRSMGMETTVRVS